MALTFIPASESEKNNIIATWPNVYQYEGIVFNMNYSDGDATTPLYRVYDVQDGSHFLYGQLGRSGYR